VEKIGSVCIGRCACREMRFCKTW